MNPPYHKARNTISGFVIRKFKPVTVAEAVIWKANLKHFADGCLFLDSIFFIEFKSFIVVD
jgi:hypothetical protein